MKAFVVFLLVFICVSSQSQSLTGGWDRRDGSASESRIYTGSFFSVALYDQSGKTFASTYGGKYTLKEGKVVETIEFDTQKPDRIGTDITHKVTVAKDGKSLMMDDLKLSRVDDGTPGKLSGAWLITGRVNEKGETRRSTPGARRTMKILSGSRFQWIAYNVETKEFFGTGGGAYTTVDGKYTENIEFFSRDGSRVGASLSFDFSLTDGEWHHKGLSSKGEPLNEIWTPREKVGI